MLLSGGLIFDGFSSFIANEAGVGGLAIESFGELEYEWENFEMMFVNNSFHCPLGQYSFDADIDVSHPGATVHRASARMRLVRTKDGRL